MKDLWLVSLMWLVFGIIFVYAAINESNGWGQVTFAGVACICYTFSYQVYKAWNNWR